VPWAQGLKVKTFFRETSYFGSGKRNYCQEVEQIDQVFFFFSKVPRALRLVIPTLTVSEFTLPVIYLYRKKVETQTGVAGPQVKGKGALQQSCPQKTFLNCYLID